MRCYVIIPCRYDSTRLPGKVLLSVNGRPLVRWVYDGIRGSRLVEDIFIATDDDRIREVCETFGVKVVMTRKDHPSGTDRVAEAASKLGCADDDIVVNVQGDEPLVNSEMVDLLVRALMDNPEVPMATLAFPSRSPEDFRNPNVVKVVFDQKRRALYFSRASIPFDRDGSESFLFWKHQGFYAYRFGFLREFVSWKPSELERREKLEQLRALEHGVPILVVPSPRDTVGVDTPEDLERIRSRLGAF